jgi:hypothetical protein
MSPLGSQHELDLCATGLGPNWATGVTVADSVGALGEYHSRWGNVEIDKYKITVSLPSCDRETTAGGVYGVAADEETQLFTLPLNPRATQPKTWKISSWF